MEERQAAIQAEAMLDLVEERLTTKKELAEQDLRLAAKPPAYPVPLAQEMRLPAPAPAPTNPLIPPK
ncbi:MAG: hypothetical protein HQL94_08020 [Magnetococcales bacterium]|nr:hypothetical protein [Magnetococcales bacterium]